MVTKHSQFDEGNLEESKSDSADLSFDEVNQDASECRILIYGAAEDFVAEDIKYGQVTDVGKRGDALVVTFSNNKEASKAVKKLNGKNGLMVCKDYTPPILATGHKPDLFVIRDVPEEISVYDIWAALSGDDVQILHISLLPTSNRHVMIKCKEHKALLNRNKTRLNNWRILIDLWTDFCFAMTRSNVVLVQNLPEGSTVDSVKHLLGISEDLKYVEIIEGQKCALVYCQSKPIVDRIINFSYDHLGVKVSLYKQVAEYEHMVFISNMHETTKEKHLIKHFEHCNILKVNVRLDQRSGLKTAFMYLEDEENFKRALKLDGTELLGQTIAVQAKSELATVNSVQSNRVYITNLHRGCTSLQLCLFFQDCGHIVSASVPKQKRIVNQTEAVLIIFRDQEAAQAALKKTGLKIRGRRIEVHSLDPYANQNKRKKSDRKRLQSKKVNSMKRILPATEKFLIKKRGKKCTM